MKIGDDAESNAKHIKLHDQNVKTIEAVVKASATQDHETERVLEDELQLALRPAQQACGEKGGQGVEAQCHHAHDLDNVVGVVLVLEQ